MRVNSSRVRCAGEPEAGREAKMIAIVGGRMLGHIVTPPGEGPLVVRSGASLDGRELVLDRGARGGDAVLVAHAPAHGGGAGGVGGVVEQPAELGGGRPGVISLAV